MISIMHGSHSQEMTWGNLHPLFVHFPIVLFSAALVCDLLCAFGKKPTLIIGHWLIIAAVLFCIPTILSGLEAADLHDPLDPIIAKHEKLGLLTGLFGSLYSGLRIADLWWKLALKPTFYVVLSLLMVALVSWTSDYGALISHGVSTFDFFQTKLF